MDADGSYALLCAEMGCQDDIAGRLRRALAGRTMSGGQGDSSARRAYERLAAWGWHSLERGKQ